MEALFVRQLRQCTQFQDELRDYDRLLPGDERRCYKALLNSAHLHVKRVRLQKHREAMTNHIAGGNALASMHQNPNPKGGTEVTKEKARARRKEKEIIIRAPKDPQPKKTR